MAFTKVSNTKVFNYSEGSMDFGIICCYCSFFSFCLVSPCLSVTVLCVMSVVSLH